LTSDGVLKYVTRLSNIKKVDTGMLVATPPVCGSGKSKRRVPVLTSVVAYIPYRDISVTPPIDHISVVIPEHNGS
jgi:hypothetical protein